MAADRVIKCTNEDGVSLTVDERSLVPFILASADGIYDAKNSVYISENSMIDGAIYQGSVAKYRNIVLRLIDVSNDTATFAENRDLLNQVFKEASLGTLEFTEGDAPTRKIDYYVETLDSSAEHDRRIHDISLICPDPFFYDINSVTEEMASWVSAFEFEFESPSTGFVFGYKSQERIKTIENVAAEDNIGVTITITASGSVTNPSITRIESDESITIGHSGKTFEMQNGDIVTITTASGNKHVTLTRSGTTSEINHYLTEDSVFVQLMRGANSFGFDADSGESNMAVEISYKLKYARA